ncbi:MAG: cytochrome B6, partial [Acidobacteriota bacterium]|nr:cytochrome B6 [Acidobacteriota bacterium]
MGLTVFVFAAVFAQNPPARPAPDAVQRSQQPTAVQATRPEQQSTEHDRSEIFNADKAAAISPVLKGQP